MHFFLTKLSVTNIESNILMKWRMIPWHFSPNFTSVTVSLYGSSHQSSECANGNISIFSLHFISRFHKMLLFKYQSEDFLRGSSWIPRNWAGRRRQHQHQPARSRPSQWRTSPGPWSLPQTEIYLSYSKFFSDKFAGSHGLSLGQKSTTVFINNRKDFPEEKY